MTRASFRIVAVLAPIFGAIAACVGDDPTESGPSVPDGGTPNDATTAADTNVPADASADAATPACDLAKPFGVPDKTLFGAINTGAREEAAYLTPDELTVYFTAQRERVPGGPISFNSYRATRARIEDPFGSPEPVKGGANSDADELGVLVSDDERTMFFIKQTSSYDIYSATRATPTADWETAAAVGGGVNTGSNEYVDEYRNGELWLHRDDGFLRRLPKSGNGFGAEEPAAPELGVIAGFRLSHDGLRAIYVRAEADAGGEIWMATRTGPGAPFTGFEKPANLSSPKGDFGSWLSHDGCRLYLTSERDGTNDIFVAVRPR